MPEVEQNVDACQAEAGMVRECETCHQMVGPEHPGSPQRRYSFIDAEQALILKVRSRFPNWICQIPSPQVRAIFTIMRDQTTAREEFVFYSDRMIRLLVEQALDLLPFERYPIETPCGPYRNGVKFSSSICGVSIVRAGESMEAGLRAVCRGCRIGKILIQRNEETLEPMLYYVKLPHDIHTRRVLLLDPMLATGGSAIKALDVLCKQHGVPEENIIFINLITCAFGVEAVCTAYPKVKIVSSMIDPVLLPNGFISPGLGDFGDRYFGTTD